MDRKFKDMSDSSILEMIDEIKKKTKMGKADMREAGILLALEFELDIRKNEGKYVNVEQLEKLQATLKRACQELKEINSITISNEKALPYLENMKASLQTMEQYIEDYTAQKKGIDITEVR